jgi:hypothetical protein
MEDTYNIKLAFMFKRKLAILRVYYASFKSIPGGNLNMYTSLFRIKLFAFVLRVETITSCNSQLKVVPPFI